MKRWTLFPTVLAWMTSGAVVNAQQPGFAVNRFEPAERGSEWFVVDNLELRGKTRPAAGLTVDYAHKPLAVYDSVGNEKLALVRHQLFMHGGGSLVISDRLRLGVNLPIAVYQAGEAATVAGTRYSPANATAIGDVRLAADVRIFGRANEPITLAAGLRAWLPTGRRVQFTSDGTARVAPQVLAAGALGIFVWATRLALMARTRDTYAGSSIGSELGFGLGAGARLGPFTVGPELFASTALGRAFGAGETPVDALLGVHYMHSSGVRASAAIGSGLTRGYGSPAARLLLSVEWGAPIEPAASPADVESDPATPPM